jgi:hypothetical protein
MKIKINNKIIWEIIISPKFEKIYNQYQTDLKKYFEPVFWTSHNYSSLADTKNDIYWTVLTYNKIKWLDILKIIKEIEVFYINKSKLWN